MKILIDTNILDLLLEREPFVEEAIALFELLTRHDKTVHYND